MRSPQPKLTMLLFGCCFLAIGLTVTIGSWASYYRDTRIVESGEQVEAVVSSKQMLRPSNLIDGQKLFKPRHVCGQ